MKVRSIYTVSSQPIHSGTARQWRLFSEGDLLSGVTGFVSNILDPGVEQEPHQHEDTEHIYYILTGSGKIRVGDEEQEVRQGDAIYLPPHQVHALKNTGTYPLSFLVVTGKINLK